MPLLLLKLPLVIVFILIILFLLLLLLLLFLLIARAATSHTQFGCSRQVLIASLEAPIHRVTATTQLERRGTFSFACIYLQYNISHIYLHICYVGTGVSHRVPNGLLS